MKHDQLDAMLLKKMPCQRHQSHALREQNWRCIRYRMLFQEKPRSSILRLLDSPSLVSSVLGLCLASLFLYLKTADVDQISRQAGTSSGSAIVLISFQDVEEDLWGTPDPEAGSDQTDLLLP